MGPSHATDASKYVRKEGSTIVTENVATEAGIEMLKVYVAVSSGHIQLAHVFAMVLLTMVNHPDGDMTVI